MTGYPLPVIILGVSFGFLSILAINFADQILSVTLPYTSEFLSLWFIVASIFVINHMGAQHNLDEDQMQSSTNLHKIIIRAAGPVLVKNAVTAKFTP